MGHLGEGQVVGEARHEVLPLLRGHAADLRLDGRLEGRQTGREGLWCGAM